jgi:hypothetical protein
MCQSFDSTEFELLTASWSTSKLRTLSYVRIYDMCNPIAGARGSVVVKVLCYKPEEGLLRDSFTLLYSNCYKTRNRHYTEQYIITRWLEHSPFNLTFGFHTPMENSHTYITFFFRDCLYRLWSTTIHEVNGLHIKYICSPSNTLINFQTLHNGSLTSCEIPFNVEQKKFWII